jgi:hypothetical protein
MRVILAWGSAVQDLDLHIVEFDKETKEMFHTSFANMGCSGSTLATDNTLVRDLVNVLHSCSFLFIPVHSCSFLFILVQMCHAAHTFICTLCLQWKHTCHRQTRQLEIKFHSCLFLSHLVFSSSFFLLVLLMFFLLFLFILVCYCPVLQQTTLW